MFYNYKHKDFYAEIEEHMMTADSIVLLLINKVDSVWNEEKQEDVKLESPIVRWKELIGNKDPEVAKNEEPLPSLKEPNPDPEAEEKEIDVP